MTFFFTKIFFEGKHFHLCENSSEEDGDSEEDAEEEDGDSEEDADEDVEIDDDTVQNRTEKNHFNNNGNVPIKPFNSEEINKTQSLKVLYYHASLFYFTFSNNYSPKKTRQVYTHLKISLLW